MEKAKAKAKEHLKVCCTESEMIAKLNIPTQNSGSSFYEDFANKGIRVDRVQPGFIISTFKVPKRLTDRSGKMASGAIANLVDEAGWALVHVEGLPMNVSVDMSISFLSAAKVHDELEITARVLGQKGGYSGTIVILRNKATGEVVAEGRHSLFGKKSSKL